RTGDPLGFRQGHRRRHVGHGVSTGADTGTVLRGRMVPRAAGEPARSGLRPVSARQCGTGCRPVASTVVASTPERGSALSDRDRSGRCRPARRSPDRGKRVHLARHRQVHGAGHHGSRHACRDRLHAGRGVGVRVHQSHRGRAQRGHRSTVTATQQSSEHSTEWGGDTVTGLGVLTPPGRTEREPAVHTQPRAVWRSLLRKPAARVALVLAGSLALLAALGPLFTVDPDTTHYANELAPPSAQHWLGTDHAGRDLLARTVAGARSSLSAALLVTAI